MEERRRSSGRGSALERRTFLAWAGRGAGLLLVPESVRTAAASAPAPSPPLASKEPPPATAEGRSASTPSIPPQLSPQAREVLVAVQDVMFPDGASPGANALGAAGYLESMLGHGDVLPGVGERVRRALSLLEQRAQERTGMAFQRLDRVARNVLLRELEDDEAGAEALWDILRLTLEGVLGDPVYGGNRDGKGWAWLGVTPGFPRPVVPWPGRAARNRRGP